MLVSEQFLTFLNYILDDIRCVWNRTFKYDINRIYIGCSSNEIANAICFMISNSAVNGQLWADCIP